MKIGAIVSFIIEGDVWLYNARSKYRQKQLLNESLLVGSDPMCVVKDEEMMTTTNVREEDSLNHYLSHVSAVREEDSLDRGGFRSHVCCKRGRNDDD